MRAPPAPEEIADYTHDRKAEQRSRLPETALGVLCALSLVCTFVFMKTGYGMLFGVLFLGAAASLCWLSSKKRTILCNRCGRAMDVLDVDWSAESFRQLGGWICGSFFAGADDRIYKQGRYRYQSAPSSSYTIHLMKQRWYVCHGCKQYLLGVRLLPVTIFQASSGLKQAIENLKNDPNVGREMESRNAQG